LKTFADMQLIAPVQKALAEEKYETPTPIQSQTVPSALSGRDVLGCAQTGTGKTAAFALPILHQLGQHNRKAVPNRPFVLVLAPTRELAIQIGDSFATYGRHLKLRQALVYGGVGQAQQVRTLKRGAHLLIATPGRLLDLMNQGHIHLDQLETFVLDEADRMLDMGFLPDLRRIIAKLPEQRQSLFFSATLPPKIIELSQQLLSDPISVNVTPKSTSVERIVQRVLYVERAAKQRLLQEILTAGDVDRALVFTRTKRGANMVAEKLHKSGITATAIHGNKSQAARQRALEAFRRKHVQVLVATDVAARGIDIDGITHVVNFDMPMEPEAYVHRIGRTGRAGAEGMALSFCTSEERGDLRAIEKLIGQKVPADPRGGSEPGPHTGGPHTGGRHTGGPRTGGQRTGRPRGGKPQRTPADGPRQQLQPRRPAVRPAQETTEVTSVDANVRPRRPRRKGRNRRQRAAQTS
jgi:ATP-dependent RNA helicase RhlE